MYAVLKYGDIPIVQDYGLQNNNNDFFGHPDRRRPRVFYTRWVKRRIPSKHQTQNNYVVMRCDTNEELKKLNSLYVRNIQKNFRKPTLLAIDDILYEIPKLTFSLILYAFGKLDGHFTIYILVTYNQNTSSNENRYSKKTSKISK